MPSLHKLPRATLQLSTAQSVVSEQKLLAQDIHYLTMNCSNQPQVQEPKTSRFGMKSLQFVFISNHSHGIFWCPDFSERQRHKGSSELCSQGLLSSAGTH